MSYCVNCGVELAPSEKLCPLCGVPVNNPLNPYDATQPRPYGGKVEFVMQRVDRRYGALLALCVLLIPVICSLLLDMLLTHDLTWSGFVTGAAICIFVWVLLPLIIKRPNVYLCILFDLLALQLYLADISYITHIDMMTYVTFIMPIGMALAAAAYAFTPIVRSKRLRDTLYPYAIGSFMIGVLCVVLELIIDINLNGIFVPLWSLVAGVSCMICGVMFIIIEGKQQLKDRIHRRLFM